MKYNGEFRPPLVGVDKSPIQISGDGSLEVTEAGLIFDGFRVKGLGACSLIVLAILVLIVGTTALSAMGLEESIFIVALVLMYPVMGGAVVYGVKARKRGSGDPWRFEVPWTHLKMTGAADGCVELVIDKFKPTGKIYFYPAEHQQLVREIKENLAPTKQS